MKIKGILVFIVLILCVGVLFYFQSNKSDDSDKSTKTSQTHKDTKYIVAVLGENTLKSDAYISFKPIQLNDKLDKSIVYILVPYSTNLNDKERSYLNQLINEKRIVLLYGDSVDPKVVKDKLKIKDLETAYVKSNFEISFIMYGYGYSKKYDKNIGFFLGGRKGDTEVESKIKQYLLEHKKNK